MDEKSATNKRNSKVIEPIEINIKSYTSIVYDFDKTQYSKYSTRKPTVSEILEWNALQAKFGFYSRAKTFLGIRVAVSSWTDAYIAVTQDKFYFYKAVDELDRITDFTFELEDCVVEDIGEYQGRPHAFSVQEKKGAKVVLAADNRQQYLAFVNTIRRGCTQYLMDVKPYFEEKANALKRILRGNIYRQRFLRMKKGFTRLQAVYRGIRDRRLYHHQVHAVIIVQSFIRMCLAKNDRELLKLQGNIQKFQMARTYTFQEIVQTEESYVQDLTTLINVFLKATKGLSEETIKALEKEKNNPTLPIMIEADKMVTEVMANVTEILAVHTKFCDKLKEALKNWTEKSMVGALFVDLADQLDVYISYCCNYDNAKKAFVEAAKRNEKLQILFEVNVKQVKKLDLFGFLILPIQRVPRYSLLLSDLLKRTWKDHPDYLLIARAIVQMQKKGSHLNETRRQDEERKKTEHIVRKFRDPQAIQGVLEKSKNPACLYEGPVISNHSTPTEDDPSKYLKAQLFLFTDQLVLAKKNIEKKMNGNLRFRSTVKFSDVFSIPILHITEDAYPLGDKEAHKFGFSFAMHKMKLKMFPPSEEQRNAWITEINKARQNAALWSK